LQIGLPEVDFNGIVNPSLTLSELLIIKELANSDEHLVAPLCERLLKIPVHEKFKDRQLEDHYRTVIGQHLSQFNAWERYNGLLKENEKFKIPDLIELSSAK